MRFNRVAAAALALSLCLVAVIGVGDRDGVPGRREGGSTRCKVI